MKPTDKEWMLDLLQSPPDDSTYEEIFQKLLLGRPSVTEPADAEAAAPPGHEYPGYAAAPPEGGFKRA